MVNLLMMVFLLKTGEVVQVWTPDVQPANMDECRQKAELMLKIPLATDRTALAVCVAPATEMPWTKWYQPIKLEGNT